MRDGTIFRGKSLSEVSLLSKVPHHHLRFCLAEGRVRPEWSFARLARYERDTGRELPLELPRASVKRAREDDDSQETPPPAYTRTHSISTFGLFSTVLSDEELDIKRRRVSKMKDLLIQTTKAVHQIVTVINTPVSEDEFLHGDTFTERACFHEARAMLKPLRDLFHQLKVSFETVVLCRDLLSDRDFELLGARLFWLRLSSEAMGSLLDRVAAPSSSDVANFFWHKVNSVLSEVPAMQGLEISIRDIEKLLS